MRFLIHRIKSHKNNQLHPIGLFPKLIVNSKGYIISANKRAKKLLQLPKDYNNFLLNNSENSRNIITFYEAIAVCKSTKQFYSHTIKIGSNLKIVIGYAYYLKDDLSLVSIKNISCKENIKGQIYKRLRGQEALTLCAYILSESGYDCVNKALKNLLGVLKATNIVVYENYIDKDSNICCKLIEEASISKEFCQRGTPLSDTNYDREGFKDFRIKMSNGLFLIDKLDELSPKLKNHLKNLPTTYIAEVPIFVNNDWFGFLAIWYLKDNTRSNSFEVEFVKTISYLLSMHYRRMKDRAKIIETYKKLGKSVEAKNGLISLMSHDINNSLNGIIGFSDLLKNMHISDDENVNKYIDIINTSSTAMAFLVKNVTKWAKITDGGAITPVFKKIIPREIADQGIALLGGRINAKNINLIKESSIDLPVVADSAMMFTIFENLLINAIKFTPEEGMITLSCKKDETNENYIFIMKDTGVGMTFEKAANLFNEVKNQSTIGTNGEKGLSLGLKICKKFVLAQDGKIWAQSAPDKGTIISISIPIKNIAS